MKTIKRINTFAIALPFLILLTIPILKQDAIALSLISTIVTGFLQLCISVKMLMDDRYNKRILAYIITVVLFFVLWFINHLIGYNDMISYSLLLIPFLLAIYLSVIIYKIEEL